MHLRGVEAEVNIRTICSSNEAYCKNDSNFVSKSGWEAFKLASRLRRMVSLAYLLRCEQRYVSVYFHLHLNTCLYLLPYNYVHHKPCGEDVISLVWTYMEIVGARSLMI